MGKVQIRKIQYVEGGGYVLPSHYLYKIYDELQKNGDRVADQFMLIGIMQDLEPTQFRDVFRAIIKAIYSSGNIRVAERVSRKLVQIFDRLPPTHSDEEDNVLLAEKLLEGCKI